MAINLYKLEVFSLNELLSLINIAIPSEGERLLGGFFLLQKTKMAAVTENAKYNQSQFI